MFITKKHLSRRTVLQGAGATVALPLLDAMIPAATALANTAARPAPRLGFFYLPHGAIMDNTVHGAKMDHWTPEAEGREFRLKPILESLEPFQDYLTIVSRLGNRPAVSPAVHAITPATWLSCVSPAESVEPKMSITVDQIAAQHIGQETPFPSLEVAAEAGGVAGACDHTYGCSFSSTLSFKNATTPLPMEHNPRKLFVQLFGQGATQEERDALARQYVSVLDQVSGQAAELRRSLGASDRAALDNYLSTVRELERRAEIMAQRDMSTLDIPEMPVGVADSFDEQLDLMFDMIALAFQANLTRIVSYMMAAEVSNRTYNHIGVPDAFHPLSHHGNDIGRLERLVLIQKYHTEKFARFVQRMSEMPDGDAGSMLDNAIFVYGSNMSNSDYHDNFPLPMTVVGHGGGIRGGQHLRYPDHTPLANLHRTLLDRAGVPVETVGDSTGELAEI